MLLQDKEGMKFPVAYASRKSTEIQRQRSSMGSAKDPKIFV